VIDKIFNSLEEMDGECYERAVNWFSFHLLNTSYKWDWPRWFVSFHFMCFFVRSVNLFIYLLFGIIIREHVKDLESSNPKRIFLEAIMEKMMRSSYYEMIKKQIPPNFHQFIPPKPEPTFAFQNGNNSFPLNCLLKC
jgi:hypothetical protein